MNPSSIASRAWLSAQTRVRPLTRLNGLRAFFSGLLLPLGFAPFHFPGLTILGIALLFLQLRETSLKQSFWTGFIFGLGFLGFGVSWIYVSIHMYGHLHAVLAFGITLLFVGYLALYLGFIAFCYRLLAPKNAPLYSALLFSSLWCVGEMLRSTVFGGFPWLLLGFGQMDSPLNHLLPFIGVTGVSWVTCFAATALASAISTTGRTRTLWLTLFVSLLISPLLLKQKTIATPHGTPLSVGIIQANLSMRDKWDETLFWQLLDNYQHEAMRLMHKTQLIVMPESAIPLPSSYVSDYLDELGLEATKNHSALLLGIPHPTRLNDDRYYNSLIGLGLTEGVYFKQHLVAFGEFTPPFLSAIARALDLPLPNMAKGRSTQPLMTVDKHPIATLICYELAFPELLRRQLPLAEWIVSISDDGWFGHSLAIYQHLQMAQVLSKQTGRFQVVANNDGLSAVIDDKGDIVHALPAFSSGILEASIQPTTGISPWVTFGDTPIHILILIIVLSTIVYRLFIYSKKTPTRP